MNDSSEKFLIAKKLGMEILDSVPTRSIPRELVKKIPYAFAKKHGLIPIAHHGDLVTLAISDPLNIEALDTVREMLEHDTRVVFANPESILQAIRDCYHQQPGEASSFLANLIGEDKNKKTHIEVVHDEDLLESKEHAPIIRLLNLILSEAIQQKASDIHFEPYENDLKIRYRIDGILQNRHSPPREYQAQLLTRIKVLAKLDIAEHRLPQDGRMKLQMGGPEIDLRVSTVPIAHGERIVLRILDKSNVILGIDQLGMLPAAADHFRRLTSLTEGIILVTGPTGSGKTTTLYSALWEIDDDEKNIMTIEDPVEYKLSGIGQIAIHPKIGLTFAAGLRHILRQDPDVVMIGEIRDRETAEIAIQASLTGHLVLSTLHTNDAPSAIARLIDMGVEPYLLSSTLRGVLAQRLVRRVCPNCRIPYLPSEVELEELNLSKEKLSGGMLYHGKGCEACFDSGLKGRHGIYEMLVIDQDLQSLIAKNVPTHILRQAAQQNGFLTLREHGAHLVRSGITTVSEVLRVTRKHE